MLHMLRKIEENKHNEGKNGIYKNNWNETSRDEKYNIWNKNYNGIKNKSDNVEEKSSELKT